MKYNETIEEASNMKMTGKEALERLDKIRKRQADCQKRTTIIFSIRYHKTNDAVIIDKLKSQENKADYIRQLILKDIENEEKGGNKNEN